MEENKIKEIKNKTIEIILKKYFKYVEDGCIFLAGQEIDNLNFLLKKIEGENFKK